MPLPSGWRASQKTTKMFSNFLPAARRSVMAMDTGRIDWKEAFLFFYWDAKKLRTRPKEGHIIDRLIVDFFQQTRPSMADEGPVLNWDMTLFRLMNALRRQLGRQNSVLLQHVFLLTYRRFRHNIRGHSFNIPFSRPNRSSGRLESTAICRLGAPGN